MFKVSFRFKYGEKTSLTLRPQVPRCSPLSVPSPPPASLAQHEVEEGGATVPCPGALPHPGAVSWHSATSPSATQSPLRGQGDRSPQPALPSPLPGPAAQEAGLAAPQPWRGTRTCPCPLGIGSGFIIMQFWLQRATFSLCMKLQQVDKCLLISNPQRLKVQPLSQKYQPSQA